MYKITNTTQHNLAVGGDILSLGTSTMVRKLDDSLFALVAAGAINITDLSPGDSGGDGSSSPGTDSDGNPLPADFDTLAETYTYENGSVKTIAKTSGANTYTQTFTYTDGQLTSVSQWVKS